MINGVNETIKNEAKEQKGGLLSMLLGTLGVSLSGLSGTFFTGKGIIRAGEGTSRVGLDF